jgi:hypothetical protein
MVLAALLLVGAASPARAAHRHPPIKSITLTPDGSGTLIRITYAGRLRPITRILRSRDPIDALAVADVDNDGDLDILAAAHKGGLRLWRNAGRGRYELAGIPIAATSNRTGRGVRGGRTVLEDHPVQAGDERYDAAMPRAPALASDPCRLPPPAARERSFGAILPSFSPGRAPPSHAKAFAPCRRRHRS